MNGINPEIKDFVENSLGEVENYILHVKDFSDLTVRSICMLFLDAHHSIGDDVGAERFFQSLKGKCYLDRELWDAITKKAKDGDFIGTKRYYNYIVKEYSFHFDERYLTRYIPDRYYSILATESFTSGKYTEAQEYIQQVKDKHSVYEYELLTNLDNIRNGNEDVINSLCNTYKKERYDRLLATLCSEVAIANVKKEEYSLAERFAYAIDNTRNLAADIQRFTFQEMAIEVSKRGLYDNMAHYVNNTSVGLGNIKNLYEKILIEHMKIGLDIGPLIHYLSCNLGYHISDKYQNLFDRDMHIDNAQKESKNTIKKKVSNGFKTKSIQGKVSEDKKLSIDLDSVIFAVDKTLISNTLMQGGEYHLILENYVDELDSVYFYHDIIKILAERGDAKTILKITDKVKDLDNTDYFHILGCYKDAIIGLSKGKHFSDAFKILNNRIEMLSKNSFNFSLHGYKYWFECLAKVYAMIAQDIYGYCLEVPEGDDLNRILDVIKNTQLFPLRGLLYPLSMQKT